MVKESVTYFLNGPLSDSLYDADIGRDSYKRLFKMRPF